jgi:hypothetical protein
MNIKAEHMTESMHEKKSVRSGSDSIVNVTLHQPHLLESFDNRPSGRIMGVTEQNSGSKDGNSLFLGLEYNGIDFLLQRGKTPGDRKGPCYVRSVSHGRFGTRIDEQEIAVFQPVVGILVVQNISACGHDTRKGGSAAPDKNLTFEKSLDFLLGPSGTDMFKDLGIHGRRNIKGSAYLVDLPARLDASLGNDRPGQFFRGFFINVLHGKTGQFREHHSGIWPVGRQKMDVNPLMDELIDMIHQ